MLDPVIHQPIRTRVTAYIAARGEATFNELKKLLDATDGNLEAHIKKLVGAGYLETRKETGSGRPQTFYELTSSGRIAFKAYVLELKKLIKGLT